MTKKQKRAFISKVIATDRPFNMAKWWGEIGDLTEQGATIDQILTKGTVPEEVCGTSCCIAGEAAIRFPGSFKRVASRLIKEGVLTRDSDGKVHRTGGYVSREKEPIAVVAAEVLGVNPQAFFSDNWPYTIRNKYPDTRRNPAAAAEALEHFAVK